MKKLKEESIEKKLTKYYRKNNCKVKNQVRLSQKKIDIIYREKDSECICAVEVKIDDWKTAVRQANLNKLACHKSFVAIWHEYSHRAIKNKEVFENLGIGLIVIDELYQPVVEIEPARSNVFNGFALNLISSVI